MKKSQVERTTADNLEARFGRGEEGLDYFEVAKAQTVSPKESIAVASTVKKPQSAMAVHEETGHDGTTLKQTEPHLEGKVVRASLTTRTIVKNPKTGDWTKRDETPSSPKKGQFMDVKSDGKKFKGVAKEADNRRK